jgi:hypothetical protein
MRAYRPSHGKDGEPPMLDRWQSARACVKSRGLGAC